MDDDATTRRQGAIVWTGFILSLIVLSVDFWWWRDTTRIGGLIPAWIIYSILLQVALSFGLYRLGRKLSE
jgi:hypothetical protein